MARSSLWIAGLILLSAVATSRAELLCQAGAEVGGACWFLGDLDQSCLDVCDAAGFPYDEATASFAGSGGTNENCGEVLDALGAPGSMVTELICDEDASIGCHVEPGGGTIRIRCTRPTTADAFVAGTQRACACGALVRNAPALSPAAAAALLLVAGAWALRRRRA